MTGGAGSGCQEAAHSLYPPGPNGAQRGDGFLHCLSPADVTWHRSPERQLLGPIGRVPATPGAQTQQQPPPADLLQGGRHHGQSSWIAVGDIQDQRSDGDSGHRHRHGRKGRPALQHPLLMVDGAGQMVVQPYPIEPLALRHDRPFSDVGPGRLEWVEQQVDLHSIDPARSPGFPPRRRPISSG